MATAEQLFPELRLLTNIDTLGSLDLQPDALVLIKLEVKCKGCGEHYSSPNPTMKLRFGANIHRLDTWSRSYNHLPREVLVHRDDTPACEKCFSRLTWHISDLS